MKYYSVKDSKVGTFGNLFGAKDDYDARRSLTVAVNDQKAGNLFFFTEDFDLYKVLEIDDHTGAITETLEFVCNALELKHNE